MLQSYAIGLSAVVLLAAAWLAVQNAWRRVFPDGGAEPDALAARRGCGELECGGCDGASRNSYTRNETLDCPLSTEEETR